MYLQYTWKCSAVLAISLFFTVSLKGQGKDKILDGMVDFPAKARTAINKKLQQVEHGLDKQLEKQLKQLQKQEARIYRKMLKKDTAAAASYLSSSTLRMQELKQQLSGAQLKNNYLPALDTIKGLLSFSTGNAALPGEVKDVLTANGNALASVGKLQAQLSQAEAMRNFLKQRKEFLKEKLRQLGLTKELMKMNKQAYYYAQQVKEYKEALNDPKLLATKAIDLIKKTKFFKEFMEKNSALASLFQLSAGENNTDVASVIPGLQTRTQVNSLIQQQLGGRGGPNNQVLQQNIQEAQAQMAELKNRALKAGSSSNDDIMPEGFRPNDQKTKTFLQRLEYGANIQTQKATNYFPATSDIGLSIGYKINNKSVIGVGASFKLGLGKGWSDIKFSSQGIGIRSFIDWKIKNNFYVSGGYEQNYKNAINSIQQLQNRSVWQQSGLIGISKKIKLNSKWLKGNKVQLLYDFLHKQHIPVSQAIVFRVGYTIK